LCRCPFIFSRGGELVLNRSHTISLETKLKTARPAEVALVPPAWPVIIASGVVVALYALFYGPLMPGLVKEWYEHPNLSYGFLIPIIFVYLIWRERKVLWQFGSELTSWSIVCLSGAVLLGITGKLLADPFISRVSMVLALGGMVHLFWGWAGVKRLAFALAFLFLMIPPPYVVVKELAYYLRMFDAWFAAELLPLVGVPVYRDTYFLHLPNITLEVADVCSGTASLFAMVALGSLYAYFLPARSMAQGLVLAGAVIFPVIANLFRILLIGASVYYHGPIMLEAFFHYFSGTFTFLLALSMLLLTGEYLRRRYPLADQQRKIPALCRSHSGQIESQTSRLTRPLLIAVAVFGAALVVSNLSAAWRHVPLVNDLETISKELGPYQTVERSWVDFYVDRKAERSISRIYEGPHEQPIELFIGYRSYQTGEDRLISPKLIFPEKWEYAAMDHVVVAVGGYPSVDAIWLDTKKGPERRLVLYWYQLRGRAFATDVRYRFEQLRGALLERRSDGAVIRLATPIGEYEALEQARKRLERFAANLYPELLRVLPN
jgi:EpsI family protein